MKKFLIRLAIFCAVPLGLLLPLSWVVDTGLKKSGHFFYSEWGDIFGGRIKANMLFMGSSRAWVHFSPVIIDSMLGTQSYNLGMDGTSLDLQFERLKMFLKHNPAPRYIVQEVSLNTTVVRAKELPHYEQFLPWLGDEDVWRIYTEKYSNVSPADRYFPLFKYNNQPFLVKEGIMSFAGHGVARAKVRGYQGQLLPWDSSFDDFVRLHPAGYALPVEDSSMQLLQEYIRFCTTNQIQLIFVYAPYYYEAERYITNLNDIKAEVSKVAASHQIPMLDYTRNYLDSSRQYFYNSQHLNKLGAELLSQQVAQDLRAYMH
jgi:hypothetical protein